MASFDASELLGIKNLLEKGQFPTSQFTDLVNQEGPPVPESVVESVQGQAEGAKSAAQLHQEQAEQQTSSDAVPKTDAPSAPAEGSAETPEASAPSSSYGPERRMKHWHKAPEQPLFRPPAMAHDYLVDILQEAIPRMIDDHLNSAMSDSPDGLAPSSPRGDSSKREASTEPEYQRESHRPRVADAVETLLCQASEGQTTLNVEALTSAFIQKKLQQDIPASGNEPSLQVKVDASKSVEWETLLWKNAIRVWTGERARAIRRNHADRFIGSRFVIANKQKMKKDSE